MINQHEFLTIGISGDLMIGRMVNELLKDQPPNYIWGNLIPLLKKTDINLINLEAALTTSDEIVEKVFNFKSDPKNINVLIEGAISAVTLANNHVLDYSEKGLLETLQVLDNAGIAHVGAGKTAEDASRPAILTRRGIKIGILGYTDNEPSWKAKDNKPGVSHIDIGDFDAVKDHIITFRQEVDILIVTLHWGPNMRARPTNKFRAYAHQLIDLGVDIIHGHSAHIFQGVEVYKDKLILYDTGDFVDDYMVDPLLRNDRSFFFIVEADKKYLRSLRLIPTLISDCQVNHARDNDRKESIQRMKKLSSEFGTTLIEENNELILKICAP